MNFHIMLAESHRSRNLNFIFKVDQYLKTNMSALANFMCENISKHR